MAWFLRDKAPKPANIQAQVAIPDDAWSRCPKCSAILFTQELQKNSGVCLKCSYHFRLAPPDRIAHLVDLSSFTEIDQRLRSVDPLGFKDQKKYRDRLRDAEKKCGRIEGVMTGKARIEGIPIGLGVMDPFFMGGSMGVVVGEKLTRMLEICIDERRPAIIVSASGGARMQEGIFSLMQMAKVSAAVGKLGRSGLPYISLLTDPTTGGVAASFSMQGDVIIAEPGALIGFAGPRVIEKTIRQKLPEGFQRSEFLLEKGMIDLIVERNHLRSEIAKILGHLGF